MSTKIKFKIGEFSKLCRVTVKTLRHYEEIGLLIPFETDQWTGYRFYDISQLHKMNRIVYLKHLGFSLEEISEMFDQGFEVPTKEMINKKSKECQQNIQDLIARQRELDKLEILLQKQEKIMEKVFEKSLPSRVFATHRRKINSYHELFDLCPNVIGPEMLRLGCECPEPQYCFTVEHQEEYGKNIDIEYFEAVAEAKEDSELIKFKALPEVPLALCINHYGPYEKMPETFAQLYAYAEAHGYQPTELARFNYIDGIWNKESVNEWLTEIQLPVKK
ncbi:MAG: MerR family transcriptional regulator [Bacteroidales bacterium]|nr:MerR family transcriptional regulator [Bacteroidales bacterium]